MNNAKREQIRYSVVAGTPGTVRILGVQFHEDKVEIVRRLHLPHDSRLVRVLCPMFEPAGLRN